MKKVEITERDLFLIYNAGFTHGYNGAFSKNELGLPDIGMYEAFERLMKGESPLNDGTRYDIRIQSVTP